MISLNKEEKIMQIDDDLSLIIRNFEMAKAVAINKYPKDVKGIQNFINELKKCKKIEFAYWYITKKYLWSENENKSRFDWINYEKYNGIQLYSAEHILQFIYKNKPTPKMPKIEDIQKGEILSNNQIYAIFGKWNEMRGYLWKKDDGVMVIVNGYNKCKNKWLEHEKLLKYEFGEFDLNGSPLNSTFKSIKQRKDALMSNSVILYMFDKKIAECNKFLGKASCIKTTREKLDNGKLVDYLFIQIL